MTDTVGDGDAVGDAATAVSDGVGVAPGVDVSFDSEALAPWGTTIIPIKTTAITLNRGEQRMPLNKNLLEASSGRGCLALFIVGYCHFVMGYDDQFRAKTRVEIRLPDQRLRCTIEI